MSHSIYKPNPKFITKFKSIVVLHLKVCLNTSITQTFTSF